MDLFIILYIDGKYRTFRTKSDLDSICDNVDTFYQLLPTIFSEGDLLCHLQAATSSDIGDQSE